MSGIKHKDIGDILSKAEWLASDAHEIVNNVDMDGHYHLNEKRIRCCGAVMIGGATDIEIDCLPATVLEQDIHVHKLAVALDAAPGSGKSVVVSLTNGITTMVVTLSDSEKQGITTDNQFDLDVSAQDYTVTYTQTAGGATTRATITTIYSWKINA